VEPTVVLAIPRESLAAKLEDEPRFAARWYRAFALILAQRLRQRVLALTQQLHRTEGSEDPYADAWRPLEEVLEDLKSRFTAADKEALQNGRVSDSTATEIEQRFAGCAGLMNEVLGERSGLNEHVRDELGGRVKLDLLPFLLLTTCAEQMYSKPRGYAGDFMSLEVIYQNQAQGSGRLGPLIDRCFQDLPAAQAVRNRRALLAEEIRRTCAPVSDSAARITSLACGAAPEVFDVLADSGDSQRLHATLIDIDEEALVFVQRRARQSGVLDRLTLAQANLVYLAVGRHRLELPPQDLVYSVGLIDYFHDPFVLKLMNYAHALLRPGGRLILGSFHPANPSRAIMEHVLEWNLIHRTEDDLHNLFAASAFGRPCTRIRFEPLGVNMFAECVKA
jgi:SAM-dependent methyltransferase